MLLDQLLSPVQSEAIVAYRVLKVRKDEARGDPCVRPRFHMQLDTWDGVVGASVLAQGGDFYTTGRQRKLRGRGGDRAESGHTLLHPKPGKATRPTLPATVGISWEMWQIISALKRMWHCPGDTCRLIKARLPAMRYRLASFPRGQSRGVGAKSVSTRDTTEGLFLLLPCVDR